MHQLEAIYVLHYLLVELLNQYDHLLYDQHSGSSWQALNNWGLALQVIFFI